MRWKVDFIQQPAITSSVVGLRRSSKALPKARLTPKKGHGRFGGLLPIWFTAAAAVAKSLQLCLTLCDPIDGSPPGSPVPGILQARTLEWVVISFSNACKWKVKVNSLCPTLSDPTDFSPPRLLHPWDFPGKSTGVGCHCLLHLIHYSFLNPSETITTEKYVQQIDEMHQKLQCLQQTLVTRKGPVLLQENAWWQIAQPMLQKLTNSGHQVLPHLPY